MTKREIDLISSKNKGVRGKIYYDEFGNTYTGTESGRIVRYIANNNVNQQTVTAPVTVTNITNNTVTPSIALDDLTDVSLSSPASNDYLVYNGTDWVNQSVLSGAGTVTSVGFTAGTGINISGTNPITSSGTITIDNSAPDQTVVLTSGTGINVTGTYPNFTIAATGSSTGTVTSITASSPLTGGTITTSGSIGIPVATSSADGYLSSTDWSTFNNKQGTISLTTTGTSGAATFGSNILNVPQYPSQNIIYSLAATF